MRECRRRIDIDALPPFPVPPEPAPCLHFIAAWGPGRRSLLEEVLYGLEGNRELLIRNIRPADYAADTLDPLAESVEQAVRYYAHVVDDTAVFGDVHERNAVGRSLATILLGPDPLADARWKGPQ
jgi:hypothetical protein